MIENEKEVEKYDCKCVYSTNTAEGKLLALGIIFKGEWETGLGEEAINELTSIDGYGRDNPLNFILEGIYGANEKILKKSKESYIAIIHSTTFIPSDIIIKFKGIIVDDTATHQVFIAPHENLIQYHHSITVAREAGIPIVALEDVVKKLKPGQKVRLEPKAPVGKIIILKE